MAEFDNTNRGVLFVNDRKQPGDNKPDRSGTLNVEGVEYFFDGWIKKSTAGATFMSVSVKRKDKQSGQQHQQAALPAARPAPTRPAAPTGGGFDDLDDVPF